MKLLTLCGFLLFCLLCLNVFAAEGQKARRWCCSKVPRLKNKPHKGISSKMTRMEIRKYCKPCSQRVPPVIPGPLPQLK